MRANKLTVWPKDYAGKRRIKCSIALGERNKLIEDILCDHGHAPPAQAATAQTSKKIKAFVTLLSSIDIGIKANYNLMQLHQL